MIFEGKCSKFYMDCQAEIMPPMHRAIQSYLNNFFGVTSRTAWYICKSIDNRSNEYILIFQRVNVLFTDLFIDVKPNESIMDQLNLSFIYEDLGTGMDRMKRLLNSVSCTG